MQSLRFQDPPAPLVQPALQARTPLSQVLQVLKVKLDPLVLQGLRERLELQVLQGLRERLELQVLLV